MDVILFSISESVKFFIIQTLCTYYQFIHHIIQVSPQCGTFKWCTLTKTCEKNCVTDFESKTTKYDSDGNFIDFYTCREDKEYCSAEETCSNDLKCPTSITKGIEPR